MRPWLEQLTSERIVYRTSQGRRVRLWRPRSTGVKQEALDCTVYAYAAMIGRGGLTVLSYRAAGGAKGSAPPPEAPGDHHRRRRRHSMRRGGRNCRGADGSRAGGNKCRRLPIKFQILSSPAICGPGRGI